jgi:membrane protein
MNAHQDGAERGREAEKPSEIPRKGWRDVAVRVKNEQSSDNLSIIAAGAAFYAMLAIVPALAAAVTLYGLVADPASIQQHLQAVADIIPPAAYEILQSQLSRIAQKAETALSIGLVVSLIAALWSANKGMKALITSLNIVYDEEENRGFFKLNLWSMLLTICAILFSLLALTAIVALPFIIDSLGLPEIISNVVVLLRWPLLALVGIVALALIYRYAPDRDRPRWQWVSWGSVLAAVMWIVASLLFSWYVSNFDSYNKTYGSMGTVVILMMWFFLSTYFLLLGGEINAEMEHQTRKDTTTGEARSMGQRGAYAADTLGEEHPSKPREQG